MLFEVWVARSPTNADLGRTQKRLRLVP